jgi:hypothetical protein
MSLTLSWHCRSSCVDDYEPGQVGIAGSQTGTGILSVADWWLATGRAVEDETEAAAAPANTIDKAMMRIASFIVGNLTWFRLTRDTSPVNSELDYSTKITRKLSVI